MRMLSEHEMSQVSGGTQAQTCATLAGIAVGGAYVSAGTTAVVAGLAFAAYCLEGDTM
jgi:hypothetical protein